MTALGTAVPAATELERFASEVGGESDGPVCVAGGRTQREVGGLPDPGTREVAAPAGVVSHQPEEMIVRVRAGTAVAALDQVLAANGQMVALDPDDPQRATVGGVLAVGRSGIRRLRYGPVRDTVLEVRFVSAQGKVVKAGGPVVKNVTGFDLCRLLVGSLGTLGLLAEVVLRCQPRPAAARWFRSVEPGVADPFDLHRRLYRASSVLWDGEHTWVLLEGHAADVADQAAAVLGPGFAEVDGPPPVIVGGGRLSVAPAALTRLGGCGGAAGAPGSWIAQVGVGVVVASDPAAVAGRLSVAWPPLVQPGAARLHGEVKRRFDPTARLNPGRRVVPA